MVQPSARPWPTVHWHRPIGAPQDVRRLTIGRRTSVWSSPTIATMCDDATWVTSCARLQVLEVDCPMAMDDLSDGYLDSLGIFQHTNPQTLKRLRCVYGCHPSVVEWFIKQFEWEAIELGNHYSKIFQCIPKSTIELRISEDLSIDDWKTLVERGKKAGILLRHFWLGRKPCDPAVVSALLQHLIRDALFVLYGNGVDGDLQWYSCLNLWAQTTKSKRDHYCRLDATKAVRIIKEWNKSDPTDGEPHTTNASLEVTGEMVVRISVDVESLPPKRVFTAIGQNR